MIPSLEIREEAAKLYDTAWACSDKLNLAEDSGATNEVLEALDDECAEAWQAYSDFCDSHEFELLTEASGYIIRCAETNIPLCDTDEVTEGEGDRLVMVVREYAA